MVKVNERTKSKTSDRSADSNKNVKNSGANPIPTTILISISMASRNDRSDVVALLHTPACSFP